MGDPIPGQVPNNPRRAGDGASRLEAALGERYAIERELGRGASNKEALMRNVLAFPRCVGRAASLVCAGALGACQSEVGGVDAYRPSAIIMGTDAGSAYANVGTMRIRRPGGEWLVGGGCTVTLLAPTIALTAGHCVVNNRNAGNELGVTFDDVVDLFSSHFITATGVEHPNYVQGDLVPGSSPNAFNEYDVGVLILDEPVVDLQPARLPRLGQLGIAALNKANDELVIVGYGVAQLPLPPPPDKEGGTRRFTTMEIVGLDDQRVIVACINEGGRGGPGDSGGPYAHAGDRPLGNGEGQRYVRTVLATFYGGHSGENPSSCADDVQLGWRIDEARTLDWVSGFLAAP